MKPSIWERLALTCITIIMAFIAYQSSRWSTSIDTLSKTVNSLNVKMEVVVNEIGHSAKNFIEIKARDDKQDEEIGRLRERTTILEHKR